MRKIGASVIVVAVALLVACGDYGDDKRFVRVERGKFRSTIAETGELQAVNYVTVFMPFFPWRYRRQEITQLAKEGTKVRKGEVIGQIGTSRVLRELVQQEAELEIAYADLAVLKAGQETEIKQLGADRRSSEAALRSAQIETERIRFESPSRREIAELGLRKAEISSNKIRRKSESTSRIHAEELKIRQRKITQTLSAIEAAERTVERFTVRAPSDGMIEYLRNRRTGKKIAVGDQLWWFRPLIGLPDLNQMKVITSVNETDISKVHVGQKTSVRLDAFPRIAFDGTVTKISKITRRKERKSKIKIFDVEVLLDKSDPILRPGMTVSCEFILAELDGALFVDHAGIHREDGESIVYVKDGSKLRRIPVTLGPRNTSSVVVHGKLHPGDRVAVVPRRKEV